METGFIIVLVLVISFSQVGIFFFLISQKKQGSFSLEKTLTDFKVDFAEKLFQFQNDAQKDQLSLQEIFEKRMSDRFELLRTTIDGQMKSVSKEVNKNLIDNLQHTSKAFEGVVQRLAKIDEAQKKIEDLSQNVVSLQGVLTDKKTRGIFGEVQLYNLLKSVFGEKSDKVFELQKKLSNGSLVDAFLHLPEPLGDLSVDSKFPLENFQKMVEEEQRRGEFKKLFKADVKRHIDAIASKYILPPETSGQAIMFLPAEAIFAELHAYHGDIIEYAQGKCVWICSPTTFMAILTTVQALLNNLEQTKYSHIIQEELGRLSGDFTRYRTRWDKFVRHIDALPKDVHEINTSTERISRRFDKIAQVQFDTDISGNLN